MSNDLSFKFKKQEIKRNGSYYYSHGYGKREKPFMTPSDYGCIKSKEKRK